MTSRVFTTEIVTHLNSALETPVFSYDQNAIQELPCVLVGIESEQAHDNLTGNYTLGVFIAILTNGYDDSGNDIAEAIKDSVFEALEGAEISCLDALYFDGAERQDGEEGTKIFLGFTAYTHSV